MGKKGSISTVFVPCSARRGLLDCHVVFEITREGAAAHANCVCQLPSTDKGDTSQDWLCWKSAGHHVKKIPKPRHAGTSEIYRDIGLA